MQLLNLLSQIPTTRAQSYQKEFDYNYWFADTSIQNASQPRVFPQGKYFDPGLRTDDAWPAVCAIHDIWTVPRIENAQDQINYILRHRKRIPKLVLDVGSGEGTASVMLAQLGYTVIALDCSPSTYHYHRAVSREFFGVLPGDNLTVYQSDLSTARVHLAQQDIDTVLLVTGGHRPNHLDNIRFFLQEWHAWIDDSLQQFKKNQTQITITGPQIFWSSDYDDLAISHDCMLDGNKLCAAFKNHADILVETPTSICVKYHGAS